jgi:hypothetical protein
MKKIRTIADAFITTINDAKRLITHLVVIRESAAHDEMLMDGMIQQTLRKVLHLTGAAELLAAGMDVLRNPAAYGATQKRIGKSRITMVQRGDVIYMYSMGSATANDIEETNGFVQELVKAIGHYMPREIWTMAFTRLVRSAEYAGALLKACETVEKIHCETTISPSTPEGKLTFQVLAMIAATERDYIVRRHTAGRVSHWRRGEWLLSGYPPGYILGEDRVLRLDHDSIPSVRELLLLLADLSLSATQIAQRSGELGISTAMLKSMYGSEATIADAGNPSQVIATLLGWTNTLRTGHYESTWRNPFPGVDNISGVPVQPVVEEDDCPHGVLVMPYDIELPTGGWASDQVFDLIEQRISRNKLASPGGSAHKRTSPLSSFFASTDNKVEYALLAGESHTYHLRRRPVDVDRKHSGWTNEQFDSVIVAVVNRRELHHSIVDEVQAAIREGLPASLDKNRFTMSGDTNISSSAGLAASLQRKLAATTRSLERARRNANQADEDAAGDLFVADVKRLFAEQQKISDEISLLEKTSKMKTLGQTFETNGALAAHALGALRNAGSIGSNELKSALRTVISNESMTPKDGRVEWTLCIELPHADGIITLGPITGTVENKRRLNYTPEVRLIRGPGIHLRRRDLNVRIKELEEKGLGHLAASCAVKCAHLDLIKALDSALEKTPLPKQINKKWASHVYKIYSSPEFVWSPNKWDLEDDLRRHLLKTLNDLGGSATAPTLAQHGVTAHQLKYLSHDSDAPSGARIVTATGTRANRLYSLIICPHCKGYASESVVTPETSGGVMCPKCMKTPDINSPKFPAWYLKGQPSIKTTI